MTEVKRYARAPDEPASEERTIAVVLTFPTETENVGNLAFKPMGTSCLAEIALRRLSQVEADELWLLSSDPSIDKLFAQGNWPNVSLASSSFPATSTQPSASHLLLLGAFHPFLRSNSISEAVRLFKMRTDIATLVSCTRSRDAIYDELGLPVVPEHDMRGLYRAAQAFQILARTPSFRSGSIDPYPFELSAQEAFLVDTDFEFDLAAAWFDSKQQRGPR